MEAYRQEEPYTMEDIYALPDGERAELIDGGEAIPAGIYENFVIRLMQFL